MEEEYPKIVVKKSAIAQAMAYCLPRWDKLCIYTTDASLNIDNNQVENAIRPVAVGRKNYLVCRQPRSSPTGSHGVLPACHLQTAWNKSLRLAERCIATYASIYYQ